MKRLLLLLAAAGLMAAGCGSSNAQPKDDPGLFAVKVVDQIVHNRYSTAWNDLHPTDQQVAPSGEYVQCETRSPVLTAPNTTKVLSVSNESVGIGELDRQSINADLADRNEAGQEQHIQLPSSEIQGAVDEDPFAEMKLSACRLALEIKPAGRAGQRQVREDQHQNTTHRCPRSECPDGRPHPGPGDGNQEP